MNIVYSFDRFGNIFALTVPNESHSQRYKDYFELIKDFQGIYNSEEDVKKYINSLKKVNKEYDL